MTFPSSVYKKGRGIESTYLQILSSCSYLLQYGHHCWLSLRLIFAIDSTTTNQKRRPLSLCRLIQVPQMAKGMQHPIQKAESGPRGIDLDLQCSMRKIGDNGVSSTSSAMFWKGSWELPSSLLQIPSQDHQITLLPKHAHSLCKSFYCLTHHQDKNPNSWMWVVCSCLLWPPSHHPFPASMQTIHFSLTIHPSASCSRQFWWQGMEPPLVTSGQEMPPWWATSLAFALNTWPGSFKLLLLHRLHIVHHVLIYPLSLLFPARN